MCSQKKSSWIIPFGGNGFVQSPRFSTEMITPCGLVNWVSTDSKISIYFHTQYPLKVLAALRMRVPEGTSRISVVLLQDNQNETVNQKIPGALREISIQGSEFQLINCGTYVIPMAGYARIDIKGIEKTGNAFAEISDVVLIPESHPLLELPYLRFVDDPEDFYFGRRGPSVHLNFPLPMKEIEYFYNEIYVPENQDVVGAYFCAIGFSGGYFGIQVNSVEERRVLFSVWSEYDSDDPNEIPEDYKVQLIRSGEDVYTGEFGSEGSGAQSYLKYPWEPRTTYKFIVQGKPINAERTMYTAWFNSSSSPDSWMLLSSFDKPKIASYLKGFYSFSENFDPQMGFRERHCTFSNQWVRDVDGNWEELTLAKFTADATSTKEARMDVSGGVGIDGDQRKFYLRNCGFFSNRVTPGTEFTRESTETLPPVDVSLLP